MNGLRWLSDRWPEVILGTLVGILVLACFGWLVLGALPLYIDIAHWVWDGIKFVPLPVYKVAGCFLAGLVAAYFAVVLIEIIDVRSDAVRFLLCAAACIAATTCTGLYAFQHLLWGVIAAVAALVVVLLYDRYCEMC